MSVIKIEEYKKIVESLSQLSSDIACLAENEDIIIAKVKLSKLENLINSSHHELDRLTHQLENFYLNNITQDPLKDEFKRVDEIYGNTT